MLTLLLLFVCLFVVVASFHLDIPLQCFVSEKAVGIVSATGPIPDLSAELDSGISPTGPIPDISAELDSGTSPTGPIPGTAAESDSQERG